MTYFTIPISARSKEELAARIADSESIGFELVKKYTKESEGTTWVNEGYRSGGEAVFRHGGNSSHTSYCAVMRRSNEEYEKQKKAAQ